MCQAVLVGEFQGEISPLDSSDFASCPLLLVKRNIWTNSQSRCASTHSPVLYLPRQHTLQGAGLFACPCARDSAILALSMDMGFPVKRSGNFLHRTLSMNKDSHCLKPFSSEQCFVKVLPHPFFLRVHILGYSNSHIRR